MTTAPRVQARVEGEERVTPLELFFDLIFVFAITQVTSLVSAHPTWSGLAEGLLVLAMLWWAWAAYAWLTSTVNPDEGVARLAMFAAMAAMLMASLAVPGAFGDNAVIFAAAYAGVRIAHLVLYVFAGRGAGDRELVLAVLRFTPSSLAAVALLFAAAGLDGSPQRVTWLVALVIDLAGPLIGRARGWHLAPGHFAERHALIVIIALGESIVALGIGAAGLPLDSGVLAAGALGMAVACALWWAYFDVVALVAEREMRETSGNAQLAMARDSYSYLHFPMIAGIILFAVGVKKTLGGVGDELETVPAVALCGGLALYLVAHVLFRLRNVRTLNTQRIVAAALLIALTPVAVEIPALATLGIAAALLTLLIAYEAIRFAEARDRIRHGEASLQP